MTIKEIYHHIIRTSDYHFSVADELAEVEGKKEQIEAHRTIGNELQAIYVMMEELPEITQK